MKLEKLIVPLLLDTAGFEKSVDIASKQVDSLGTKLSSKLTSIGENLTNIGGNLTAKVTAPIIAFGVATVFAASDVEQAIGGVEGVFKDAQGTIKEFADTSAMQVGLSKAAFFEMSTTTGALLKNLGFETKAAADETINLTERAADMAAFFGTDTATAVNAVGSALKGEFDSLEQFGVKMSAATINARALELGLVEITTNHWKIEKAQLATITTQEKYNEAVKEFGEESTEARLGLANLRLAQEALSEEMEGNVTEIDDNAKAVAALDLLYEQTGDTAGTFAAESEGLAGQIQISKARLTDLGAEIGEKLMPHVLNITEAFGGFLTKLENLDPEVVNTILSVLGVIAVVGPLILIVGKLFTIFASVISVVTTLWPILVTIGTFLISTIGAPILILIGIVAAIIAIWALWGDEIKAWAINAWENIKTSFDKIKKKVAEVVDNIKDKFTKGFESITRAIDNVKDKIKDFIDKIKEIAESMPEWLIPGSPTPFEVGLRGVREEFIKLGAINVGLPSVEGRAPVQPVQQPERIDYNRLASTLAHEIQLVLP